VVAGLAELRDGAPTAAHKSERVAELEGEFLRKHGALAEAATLLVLSKELLAIFD